MDQFITWSNTSVFYRKTGNGPAVLLIHGFGEDHSIFDKQVEFLQKNFTVLTPDLPGSGRSSENGTASLKNYAEIILLIMQQENLSHIILGGHSMGGYIAMQFSTHHADKLKALMLIHSSAFADDEEKKSARKKSIEFIKENGETEFLKATIPNLFYDPELEKNNINHLIKNNCCSADTLISYYKAMIDRDDTTETLKTISCPVLFIIGRHDKAVPFNISLKQCYLPQKSEVKILRNSAHMGMLEETKDTNEILAKFLQDVISD